MEFYTNYVMPRANTAAIM